MNGDFKTELGQATDAINAGKFNEALNSARNILVIDPEQAEAKLIEAIALSQLGNRSDASEAFVQAVELNPNDPKVRFNAAVHEFNAGNSEEARKYANEALERDPTHKGAKDLLSRMPQTVDANGFSGYSRESAAGFSPEAEGLPFIKNLGKNWLLIGWLLSGAGLILFAISLMMTLQNFPQMMSAITSGDQSKLQQISGGQNPLITILYYPVLLATLVYMILDLIHRKGNMVWLVAHIPCTCCGFGFVTLPIYLLFGRK
jgi:tetratricopeptide (TPR) repeat protein